MHKLTKVAVYGSLRKTMGNHGLLAHAEHLSTEVVNIPYYMVSLGGFPGLVDSQGHTHSIVVEVYEVDEKTLLRLDGLEGFRGEKNPSNFYDRITIYTSAGPAYIYVLNDTDWRDGDQKVDSGDWVEYRKQRVSNGGW